MNSPASSARPGLRNPPYAAARNPVSEIVAPDRYV